MWPERLDRIYRWSTCTLNPTSPSKIEPGREGGHRGSIDPNLRGTASGGPEALCREGGGGGDLSKEGLPKKSRAAWGHEGPQRFNAWGFGSRVGVTHEAKRKPCLSLNPTFEAQTPESFPCLKLGCSGGLVPALPEEPLNTRASKLPLSTTKMYPLALPTPSAWGQKVSQSLQGLRV